MEYNFDDEVENNQMFIAIEFRSRSDVSFPRLCEVLHKRTHFRCISLQNMNLRCSHMGKVSSLQEAHLLSTLEVTFKQNLASWIQLPTYMKLVGSPDPVNVGQNSCSKAEGDDLLTRACKELGSAKHVRCATLRHFPDSATRTFLAGLTCHTCGDSVPGFQIGRGRKLLAGGPYRSAT